MIVTLDIFSGMPNPSWALSAKDARDLVSRLAGKAMTAPDAMESKLGYRGVIIAARSDAEATKAGLPHAFRIGDVPNELVAPEGFALPMLGAREANDAEIWLLSTAGGTVPEGLAECVRGAIRDRDVAMKAATGRAGRGRASKKIEETARLAATAPACVIQNTPFNPAFWNTPAAQPRNNCYNYAMDCQSNTFAQPGRISGHSTTVMQCADMSAAANFDGCTVTCVGPNKNVALVVWPGYDFHWYRLHTNGFWGHKPGQGAAVNTDNQGRVIGGALNPQNCNRGPYSAFCGYRFSPVGMTVQ
jgi:hypothetical protein